VFACVRVCVRVCNFTDFTQLREHFTQLLASTLLSAGVFARVRVCVRVCNFTDFTTCECVRACVCAYVFV
jgi:hypothetical protein